jgi:acyl-coenzyme A thioesterase PaaI-like protein
VVWKTRRLVEPLHPSVRGRERELGALAVAVRRLVSLTVTSAAPAEATAAAASAVDAVSDGLEPFVPDPVPYLYVTEAPADAGPDDIAPFDVVHGEYNPLALPVEITLDPPRAIGRARFTKPYEGPPGCVHGAVLCAVFDMVFTAANRLAHAAGPTVELRVRYRRPTRLGTEAIFEGWVRERQGRLTIAEGRAVQDGEVTLEATGQFLRLPRERVMRLGEP